MREYRLIYSVRQLCELFGVGHHTVRRWLEHNGGTLPASYIAGRYYVTVYDLLDWLQTRRRKCNAGNPDLIEAKKAKS